MTRKKLPCGKDDPPLGYSLVGIVATRDDAERWYVAALKARDKKSYYLQECHTHYALYVKKRKGEGKMVGKGWGAP